MSTWAVFNWRISGTDSVRDRRREVEGVSKSNPQRFTAIIEEVEVGCGRERARTDLLFDYFAKEVLGAFITAKVQIHIFKPPAVYGMEFFSPSIPIFGTILPNLRSFYANANRTFLWKPSGCCKRF